MSSRKKAQPKLVVVSNRLPFSKVHDDKGEFRWERSTGGLITAMDPILRSTGGMWIGWDGHTVSNIHDSYAQFDIADINSAEKHAKGSYGIAVVPLTSKEYREYYIKFSNGVLWALFHYFFEKSSIDIKAWKVYETVNKRFAHYINDVTSEDDIVWVQDFHLFMVPYFLRKMRPESRIHFFLHTPFPHIDIFSILPWQRIILESLLCCNSIGFHHKQYLRNFRGAVEAYRREKRSSGESSVEESVVTNIYANPISVDFELLDRTSRLERVRKRAGEIKEKAGCSKVILGVDRIDYSKGIKERLLALELMLEEEPGLREKFFYYQLVVPSREELDAYSGLKKEIDEIIGRINGRFSTGLWTPVHYNYGKLPFKELVSFYLAADIALVTPLRDGMNLVCKEFVAAHSDEDGVLVLSKFAGAIAEIKNCIAVNPYNIEDIASALKWSMNMHAPERRKRMRKMRKKIKHNNINTWLDRCMEYMHDREDGMPA
ncbi:MAG: trehalose-6-phosphate synthase [Candidatus Omnitrophica bacterium]|nr:trehalose-6-phosphate synthase [Candidatus Omnitrophota bacterium]